MQTRPLDPHDEDQMRRFYEILWRAEKEDGRPWNPMWTFRDVQGLFGEETSERRNLALAAYDGEQMVGVGFLMMSKLDNVDTAWVFVAVEPALRGRGIGAVVMDGVVETARAEHRTQLLGGSGIPFEQRETSPVLAWAERQDFKLANTEIQRNLELPVAGALLDEIQAEVDQKVGDYEIRSYVGRLPDDLLPSFAELANLFLLEAPMGDVDVEAGASTPETVREMYDLNEKMGRTMYSTVAVLDGRVVAHSDIGVAEGDDEAHQWGTLVHPDHRGHRLGAATKVANLRRLQERQPEVKRVVTTNAETNAWMVAINDRLGFVPVAVVPTLKRLL
ncbi:MAG TPA: GNAT family N-acetyltransferase [Nocardioides sp.]|uniref:GNAT family N-acetyltransferase n=1 Tax=Nocardioides sp. TaxID=35761 RepID=UPI002D80C752|nr:GNAT family N-acetyltransferase [Nocardioides sp.]HET6652052.1 GNAT family N-acetyltransferase [Nocardioides sp.]